MFTFLISLSVGAMEQLSGAKRKCSDESDAINAHENKLIPIYVPKPRNAIAESFFIEKIDLNEEDPIHHETFKNLMKEKHDCKKPYILARATMQTGDGGPLVNYLDAHGLNGGLFRGYPFKDLKTLSDYKNPVSNLPFQWLEYYECEPGAKSFTFMCAYAALHSNRTDFWRLRFHANQDDNLELAADAKVSLGVRYIKGDGVGVDCAKAISLFREVEQQKDCSGAVVRAKVNRGLMYYHGVGVEKDGAEAVRLFTEVEQQIDDLDVSIKAKFYLGIMHADGIGTVVNCEKAKALFEELATQTYDVEYAKKAQSLLVPLAQLMSEND